MVLMMKRTIKLHFDVFVATDHPTTPFIPKIRPVHIPVPIVKYCNTYIWTISEMTAKNEHLIWLILKFLITPLEVCFSIQSGSNWGWGIAIIIWLGVAMLTLAVPLIKWIIMNNDLLFALYDSQSHKVKEVQVTEKNISWW